MKKLVLCLVCLGAVVALSFAEVDAGVYRAKAKASCSGVAKSRVYSRGRAACSGVSRSKVRARSSCAGGF